MFDNPEGSKTFVVQLGRWPEGANIAIKEPHGIVNLEEMILTVFISIKFHTVLSMAEFVFQNGEKILKRFQVILDAGVFGLDEKQYSMRG